MKAIKEGENALLESPTGTGKTLCLLTAAISALKKEIETEEAEEGADGKGSMVWGKKDENVRPKIIYTSRTFA